MMLERATAADIPAVAALMNHAFRGKGEVRSWNTEADYLDGDRTSVAMIEADIATKPGARLLLVRGEHGAPFASVWLEPLGNNLWYLGSLTVDPALQKREIGSRLLAACEAWVRARSGRRICMTVINVRHTLIAWYERRDYALTGEIEAFPHDDHRFGIPRRDDLHFVVLEKTL